jgi:DNA invertase Pin-like site-specific DNA recombinase
MAMRAAIYCRVSTGEQELENQREALLRAAEARGWRVVAVYEDIGSGAKFDREGFRKLLQDAAKRKFDAIYVWALDRLSREGLARTVQLIEQLDKWGIKIISHTEPYLDTSNELVRSILLAVIATLAKLERQKISERTKAGLERARRQGKKLGRPSVLEDEALCQRILELTQQGLSRRRIAQELGLSPTTVSKVLRLQSPKRMRSRSST